MCVDSTYFPKNQSYVLETVVSKWNTLDMGFSVEKLDFIILRTLFQHQELLAPRIYDAAVGGEGPHTRNGTRVLC